MSTRGPPRPVVTADVAFLYEGFARGELLIQVCDDCGRCRHPPSPCCSTCRSLRWTATPTSGHGRVHSYTIHHHPPIPPFELPHAVVLVDMADGFRLLAALRGVAADEVRIGLSVEMRFVELEPGTVLPVFQPVAGASP